MQSIENLQFKRCLGQAHLCLSFKTTSNLKCYIINAMRVGTVHPRLQESLLLCQSKFCRDSFLLSLLLFRYLILNMKNLVYDTDNSETKKITEPLLLSKFIALTRSQSPTKIVSHNQSRFFSLLSYFKTTF